MLDFHFGGRWYFMRSYFDDEKDEYADHYDVYLLPFHTEAEFKADPSYWTNLDKAVHLGRIPIADVGFDESRRRSIDAYAIENWLLAREQEIGANRWPK